MGTLRSRKSPSYDGMGTNWLWPTVYYNSKIYHHCPNCFVYSDQLLHQIWLQSFCHQLGYSSSCSYTKATTIPHGATVWYQQILIVHRLTFHVASLIDPQRQLCSLGYILNVHHFQNICLVSGSIFKPKWNWYIYIFKSKWFVKVWYYCSLELKYFIWNFCIFIR